MTTMKDLVPSKLLKAIGTHKIISVLIIDELSSVRPLMETLLNAGIRILELTLRTPVALEAMKIVKKDFPEIILGVGTVLTKTQLLEIKKINVDFAVSPGLNEDILKEAINIGMPFFPGVATPSEIERALSYGCTLLKFFPSEPMGGLAYLKSVNAAYAHMDVKYIPLGGVNISNLKSYISDPNIFAVGGSWLAPQNLIREANWKQISANVKEALAIIQ